VPRGVRVPAGCGLSGQAGEGRGIGPGPGGGRTRIKRHHVTPNIGVDGAPADRSAAVSSITLGTPDNHKAFLPATN